MESRIGLVYISTFYSTLVLVHDLAEEPPDDAVLPGEVVLGVVAERLGQLQLDVLVRVQLRVGLRLLHLLVVLHVGVALLSGMDKLQLSLFIDFWVIF